MSWIKGGPRPWGMKRYSRLDDVLGRWWNASDQALKLGIRKTERLVSHALAEYRHTHEDAS